MKSLHASVTAEKNKVNPAPYLVIEVQYAVAIGTKYYSEKVLISPATETDLLVNAGSLVQQINEDKGGTQGITIEISDTTKAILGFLRAEEIYKKTVKVYQCFVGVLWADQTLIWQGTAKTATRKEQGESVTFNCEGCQANYDSKIGTNVTETTAKKQGEVLPIVYGHVKHSKCVQTIESKRTTLVVPLKIDGTSGVVSDGSEFVQNSYYDFWIGQELVRGKFEGCKITLSQRGKIIQTGKTTWNPPNGRTFRANLTPQGYSWVGYKAKFYLPPPTGVITVTISNFTSADIYGIKEYANIPKGTYYEIYTPASNHDTGEEVYEKLDEYKWVINDAVSTKVDFIEVKSSVSMEGENTSSKMKEIETWVRLDERYTTVTLNDAGKTTVTLPFDPRHLRNSPYKETDLYATLTGINFSNAVDIIVDIAKQFGLAYPGDFDLVSEASERTKVDWLKMGLVINERLVFEVIFDIAFQARLSLKFLNNKLAFKYLQNKSQTSVKTIADADREYDSLEITQDEVIANKIEVIYAEDYRVEKSNRFEISDATSITAYGEKLKTLQLWAIQDEVYARGVANFWLRRWAYPLEKAKLNTFLNSMELDLNDWVTLNSTGNYTAQPAEIIEVNQAPSGNEIDKISYELRLPRWASCASTCEQYEETGCASTCEQYCTSTAETACGYACETSDQTACALTCVTTCELECTTYCQMNGDQTGCGSGCQNACQTGCTSSGCQSNGCESDCTSGCQTNGCTTGVETGCETTCEIACEVACEVDVQTCIGTCETSCQMTCVTGCENACEATACQTACQTGCENSCESTGCQSTACQTGCTTGCQGACQTGCTTGCTVACTTGAEACNASCQACCEGTCQSTCENFWQSTCQNSCTSDLQLVSQTNCTAKCEANCQGACEGACQSCCQVDGTETGYKCLTGCQTGCINMCQTVRQTEAQNGGAGACATACQGYCMTSAAQAGCTLYCTVGCMCGCELTCEANCRSGCETLCQCQCQTNIEGNCETSAEDCYNFCASGIQTAPPSICSMDCQAYCQTADAQVGCALYCTVGCQCDCEGLCEVGCQTGCETKCECLCQTAAQTANTCAQIAQVGDTCFSSCRDYCQTAQQTSLCITSCQAFCMTGGCQVGCQMYCTVGCMCACTQFCQTGCRSGCETTCVCTCQTRAVIDYLGTSCAVDCRSAKMFLANPGVAYCLSTCTAICTTNCQDYCQTTQTTSMCLTSCTSFCMTGGCQVGCEMYCTIGCMCDCIATCQSFCRDGCEMTCQCLCQTAAQV